jgi:hypothetical protein
MSMPVANRQSGKTDAGPAGNVEDAARIIPADRKLGRARAHDVQALADQQLPRKTRNRAADGESDDIPVIRIGERSAKGTVAAIRQGRDDDRAALAPQRLKRRPENQSGERRFPEQM